MGQIFRRGQSGQLYRTQIAGTAPTAQELEKFRDTVAKRGDTLILGDQPQDVGDNPPGTAFGRGFSMGIDQTQAMFGRALQSVGENIGFGGLEEYGREGVRHNEDLGVTVAIDITRNRPVGPRKRHLLGFKRRAVPTLRDE